MIFGTWQLYCVIRTGQLTGKWPAKTALFCSNGISKQFAGEFEALAVYQINRLVKNKNVESPGVLRVGQINQTDKNITETHIFGKVILSQLAPMAN